MFRLFLSSKYVQQWDHAWAMLTDWAGKDGLWDLGWKNHCILPSMRCYLITWMGGQYSGVLHSCVVLSLNFSLGKYLKLMPSHPGNSWASVSPKVVCSIWVLSVWYVCMYVRPYVMAGAAGAAGHLYLVLLLPPHVPSLLSSKYVQQWDHAWARLTDRAGKDQCWDSGQKNHCILPSMRCYLTHVCPRPTMFYIHLVYTYVHMYKQHLP